MNWTRDHMTQLRDIYLDPDGWIFIPSELGHLEEYVLRVVREKLHPAVGTKRLKELRRRVVELLDCWLQEQDE